MNYIQDQCSQFFFRADFDQCTLLEIHNFCRSNFFYERPSPLTQRQVKSMHEEIGVGLTSIRNFDISVWKFLHIEGYPGVIGIEVRGYDIQGLTVRMKMKPLGQTFNITINQAAAFDCHLNLPARRLGQ